MASRHHLLDNIQIEISLALVSHEARDIALAWMRGQDIKMRFSNKRQCYIFMRPFDQMRDTLYVPLDQKHDFSMSIGIEWTTQVSRTVILLYSHNLHILLCRKPCFKLILPQYANFSKFPSSQKGSLSLSTRSPTLKTIARRCSKSGSLGALKDRHYCEIIIAADSNGRLARKLVLRPYKWLEKTIRISTRHWSRTVSAASRSGLLLLWKDRQLSLGAFGKKGRAVQKFMINLACHANFLKPAYWLGPLQGQLPYSHSQAAITGRSIQDPTSNSQLHEYNGQAMDIVWDGSKPSTAADDVFSPDLFT